MRKKWTRQEREWKEKQRRRKVFREWQRENPFLRRSDFTNGAEYISHMKRWGAENNEMHTWVWGEDWKSIYRCKCYWCKSSKGRSSQQADDITRDNMDLLYSYEEDKDDDEGEQ